MSIAAILLAGLLMASPGMAQSGQRLRFSAGPADGPDALRQFLNDRPARYWYVFVNAPKLMGFDSLQVMSAIPFYDLSLPEAVKTIGRISGPI